jgi:hypothetical protein
MGVVVVETAVVVEVVELVATVDVVTRGVARLLLINSREPTTATAAATEMPIRRSKRWRLA